MKDHGERIMQLAQRLTHAKATIATQAAAIHGLNARLQEVEKLVEDIISEELVNLDDKLKTVNRRLERADERFRRVEGRVEHLGG